MGAGSLKGQDAAVKLVPVEGADELLARLRREAQVYCVLRPLWGDKVPALLAAGYGRDRCCYLLATARVGNAPAAEVDLSRADHRALLPAATRALAAIHIQAGRAAPRPARRQHAGRAANGCLGVAHRAVCGLWVRALRQQPG